MTAITEAGFQAELLREAQASRKLRKDFVAEPEWARNTPQRLRAALAPFRNDGTLPIPAGQRFHRG